MCDLVGSTFMQINEYCQDCERRHFIQSWYVFVPKVGPLRREFAQHGTWSVKIDDINSINKDKVDQTMKEFNVEPVEYGLL